jgi:hypothetical protein
MTDKDDELRLLFDTPLALPLWRVVQQSENEFNTGDRVVYERPSWDPLYPHARHGIVTGWVMEAQSHNVQSLIPERLYAVRWDGLHGKVEQGYRFRYLKREEK